LQERDVNRRRVLAGILLLGFIICGVGAMAWSRIEPRNDRRWIPEQARLARASFYEDSVVIENVRDFDWSADGAPAPRWETRTYDLRAIESVWYLLSPFGEFRGPAHAFLSFGFADGSYVSISVEARKQEGETYSLMKGMLKRFELMYVIGSEPDFIGLRTLRFDDDVFLYPVRATQDAARTLFLGMLEAANQLASEPAFYGTIRNNCTTRILLHANTVAPDPIPWSIRILLPGYSDALALEAGLLDTDLALEEARAHHRINERARAVAGEPDFSHLIRAPTQLRR
jgi:hypothetical protein